MKYILLAIILYCAEWIIYPDAEWEFLLGNKYLIIALLSTAIFIEFKATILNRSVFALLTISVWCDFITYSLRQTRAIEIDLSIPCSLIFFLWLYFTMKRDYPEFIDNQNPDNVNILIRHPKTIPEIIKSLFGFPSSSVCILAGGYVWAFRKKSGKYEKFIATQEWIDSHLIINTGIFATRTIIKELENNLGTKRLPFCKCVWTIRNVLNMLGGKYRVISWLDYVPGIYIFRVLRG